MNRYRFKNPSKVYLFSGNDNIVDYYSSIKLKAINPEFKLRILNNKPHRIAPSIHETVDLSVLSEKIFFENDESILDEIGHSKLVDYNTALDIKTFREKVRLEKTIDLSFKDSIVNTALEFPEWALVQYYSYLIYKELKDLENQEKYLLKTLEAKKTHTTARLDLAKLYFNQEKLHKALDHLLVLKEHKFSFTCGDLLYKVLVKLEKQDEAKEVLEEISKLELNDKQKKVLEGYRNKK